MLTNLLRSFPSLRGIRNYSLFVSFEGEIFFIVSLLESLLGGVIVIRFIIALRRLDKGRFHFRFGKRVDKWRHEGLSPVSVLRGAGVQGGHSLRTENQRSSGGECILRNG